ncbi:MAG: phytanoyl-CoA dioxygenase family protein [Candidatus Poribacteria bacterium]|nr:phytanoyl-CoA dioxygenase family protein [Candidatus Poribacteria bacterium]
MVKDEIFQERVVRVEKSSAHFTLLRNATGEFLGVSDTNEPSVYDYVDDKAIWKQVEGKNTYRHVVTEIQLETEAADVENGCYLRHQGNLLASDGSVASEGSVFSAGHGPAHLPSEYLESFKENGWVCLPSIVAPDILEELERVSCTGRWEAETYQRSVPPLNETAAVAKIITEPVSLWLMRQYMKTHEIRLGHSPGFAILAPDDGKRNVQGWHSDFPYLWGIAGSEAVNRIPVHQVDGLVMGVQRNLCVSEFRKENGATCFKLGSHTLGQGPPIEWINGNTSRQDGFRESKGLPYTGPEADVIEAPPGSYIVYDSRIWHRAGVNRTERKRAAILQAVIPMFIMPFMDTSRPYKDFIHSPLADELTELERKELEAVMVNKMVGPAGHLAITVDEELTDRIGGHSYARRR